MKYFKIENPKDKKVLASRATLANHFFSRLKGLLGTKELPSGRGIILEPCNCIHTLFMHYDLDVIFLDEDNRVVALNERLKPYRFSSYYGKAKKAIELPAGTLEKTELSIGEKLEIVELC